MVMMWNDGSSRELNNATVFFIAWLCAFMLGIVTMFFLVGNGAPLSDWCSGL